MGSPSKTPAFGDDTITAMSVEVKYGRPVAVLIWPRSLLKEFTSKIPLMTEPS